MESYFILPAEFGNFIIYGQGYQIQIESENQKSNQIFNILLKIYSTIDFQIIVSPYFEYTNNNKIHTQLQQRMDASFFMPPKLSWAATHELLLLFSIQYFYWKLCISSLLIRKL